MVNLQAERRTNPYPLTWEVPAGVAALWILLALLSVHVGRALANATAGAGWRWPTGTALISSLPKVVTGHATAGIPGPMPVTAAPATVIGWIIATELVLLAAVIAASSWTWRRYGSGRMLGMAEAAQAEQILGLRRLRTVRRIIRPDLYAPKPTRTHSNGGHDGYHPAA